ncbi:hypothetical protein [Neobacillus sp. CF12]|uniref:hypothetical protein n=1 Tax=Neobacillus sp. CF12 TaxID=3055864 RepID=UPI0025A27890|nr:hypothetical protein [Neobacillus sp. CF12]MDM5330206.1 hypothetical protein [Neobacillus sp. CF12]
MEKPLNDLSILTNYQNRQVILNYYQDEDLLYKRDGFYFHTIKVTEIAIIFTKEDGPDFTINRKDYPHAYINTDFPNYFILKNNTDVLQIYFP